MVERRDYVYVDPAKKAGIPQWKIELDARIHLDSNVERFPDMVHVPFEVTPDAVLDEDFEPHEDVVYLTIPNTRSQRRQRLIFYKQKMSEEEESHIRQFYDHLAQRKLVLPEWWPLQESLRNLQACNWNYEKAYDQCLVVINWRANNLPIALDDPHVRLLKAGFFSVFGRDRYNRTVCIIRPMVITRLRFTDFKIIEITCCFVMFYILNHMHKDGCVENTICIVDLENEMPWNLPVRALKSFHVTM